MLQSSINLLEERLKQVADTQSRTVAQANRMKNDLKSLEHDIIRGTELIHDLQHAIMLLRNSEGIVAATGSEKPGQSDPLQAQAVQYNVKAVYARWLAQRNGIQELRLPNTCLDYIDKEKLPNL